MVGGLFVDPLNAFLIHFCSVIPKNLQLNFCKFDNLLLQKGLCLNFSDFQVCLDFVLPPKSTGEIYVFCCNSFFCNRLRHFLTKGKKNSDWFFSSADKLFQTNLHASDTGFYSANHNFAKVQLQESQEHCSTEKNCPKKMEYAILFQKWLQKITLHSFTVLSYAHSSNTNWFFQYDWLHCRLCGYQWDFEYNRRKWNRFFSCRRNAMRPNIQKWDSPTLFLCREILRQTSFFSATTLSDPVFVHQRD